MARSGTELSHKPFPIGTRGWVLLTAIAFGLWAWFYLGLAPSQLVPRDAAPLTRFLGAALHPAIDSQDPSLGDAGRYLVLGNTLEGLGRTILFAAASLLLSVLAGFVLGFLATSTWWRGDAVTSSRTWGRFLRRGFGPIVNACAKLLATLLRSVHELFWALIFLAAFGSGPLTGVLALALPFSGILGKIYAEMLEESPAGPSQGLRDLGASRLQVFFFGRLPTAFPDMMAYTLYRFECALRSSAVLGFFGYPTIGYFMKLSFENLYYGEVWTYLYGLFLLVLLVDAWSGSLRRRLVA
jgi:phosphonate transport system permease protein